MPCSTIKMMAISSVVPVASSALSYCKTFMATFEFAFSCVVLFCFSYMRHQGTNMLLNPVQDFFPKFSLHVYVV